MWLLAGLTLGFLISEMRHAGVFTRHDPGFPTFEDYWRDSPTIEDDPDTWPQFTLEEVGALTQHIQRLPETER